MNSKEWEAAHYFNYSVQSLDSERKEEERQHRASKGNRINQVFWDL